MKNIIMEITDKISGAALWMDEWNTYINCYIVKSNEDIYLIDTGFKQQSDDLIKILSSKNIDISKISAVIATHGHKDHVGNVGLFQNAKKFVHINDLKIAEENKGKCFQYLKGSNGALLEFEWRLIGGHTPGSIALYHNNSKILFVGDEICFFGVPLPEEGLVSEAGELRELDFQFVSSGEFSKAFKAQNINPIHIAEGFQKMAEYDIEFLCTGHGVVLKENIPSFLNKLADAIIEYENSYAEAVVS